MCARAYTAEMVHNIIICVVNGLCTQCIHYCHTIQRRDIDIIIIIVSYFVGFIDDTTRVSRKRVRARIQSRRARYDTCHYNNTSRTCIRGAPITKTEPARYQGPDIGGFSCIASNFSNERLKPLT